MILFRIFALFLSFLHRPSDVKQSLTDYNYYLLLLYQTFLTNFGALYLSELLTYLGQILDSKYYDQA